MPIVALPDGREVEFPEGASPDLIQGALRKDFPQFFGDPRTTRKAELQAQQTQARAEGEDISWGTGYRAEQAAAFGNVGRGLAQVPAGTLKFAGTVADSVRRWAPDASQVGQLGVGGDQSALTTAGEWIEQQANRLPSNDPEALDAQFQTGIGQLGGMMTGGALVGKMAGKLVTRGALAAGGSEKAAERLAGRAASAYGQGGAVAAGFGQEFSDAFERSQRLGDDPDTGLAKSLGYAGVATMIESAAGAGRLFRQYFPSPQQAQQALTKMGVSRAVAGNFLAGYGEEASQRIAQNIIIEPGSDPLAGANEEGRVGALVQGLVGLPAAGRGYRPSTTRTPDGREVIVNQETGTTEFAAPSGETSNPQLSTPNSQPTAAVFRGANGEDIRVDLGGATLEQAQAAIFRQNPGAEFVGTEAAPASQPSTSPALRGEAAMETRPSAEMGLDRTQPRTLNPELSTDLADTIAALRAGYRPELEKTAAAGVMPAKSAELQALLREAGMVKGTGISGEGIRLVSSVAKEKEIPDWPNTRDVADYDALIAGVRERLAAPAPEARGEVEKEPLPAAFEFLADAPFDEANVSARSNALAEITNMPGELFVPGMSNNPRIALASALVPNMRGLYEQGVRPGATVEFNGEPWTVKRFEIVDEFTHQPLKLVLESGGEYGKQRRVDPSEVKVSKVQPSEEYVKPEKQKDIQPAKINIPIHRENLRDKTGVLRDWILKRREADDKTASPTLKSWAQTFDRFEKLYAARPFAETLEQFAAKYAEDFDGVQMAQDFTPAQLDQVKQLLLRQSDVWLLNQPSGEMVKQNQQNPVSRALLSTLGVVQSAQKRGAVKSAREKPAKPENKKKPVLGSGMKMTEVRPGQWKFSYQGRSVKAMTDGRGISVRLFNGDTATATYALVESQAAAQQWAKEQLYGAPTPAAAKPAPDRIETLLDAAEAKLKGSGGLMEGVTGLPVWVTREAARGVIKVMRVAYLATRDIAAALRAGLDWLRNQNLKGFIEAEANEFITGLVRGEWGEGSMDGNKTDGLKLLDGELDLGFKSTPTVFEIAMGFQDRFGRAIDYTNLRPEDNGRLVASLVQEIKRAVKLHPEALGWYDENLNLAMDVMRDLDPDLAKPENNFIFKAILAATSDGNKVGPQFKQTWQEYSHWKKHHQIYGGFVSGDRGENIRANLSMLNELIAHAGWEQTRDFMVRKGTVAELRQALVDVYGWTKEQANKIGTAERIDERVPFAIVLGPKLGSFFANLYGDYSSVTMDRWFMRTIGRLTGTLAALLPEGKLREMRNRLRDAVSKLTPEQFSLLNIPRGRLVGSGINDSATTISGRFAKKDLREVAQQLEESGQPALENVRLAANALKKGLRPMAEAPDNGTHRRWIRERVDEVQQILKADGIEMENADLQAVLWYLEKELYEKLKYRIKKGDNDYAAAANSVYEAIDGRQSPKYRRGLGRIRAIGDGSQAGVGGAAEGRAAPVRSQEQVDSADAADKTVRDYLGGTSANPFLDPKFWQAVAVSGARMLRDLGQFTATQAKWSAAMLKQFGQRIQQALAATWNRLMRLQTQQTNGVSAIGQGHLNQIELASVNANIAEEQKPVYSEQDLAKGAPGLGIRLQPMSKQIAYLGGAALLASKQKLDVTGALQAAAVKKQSDALWQQLVESSASGNPLTKWKLPAWLIGSPRARAFKTRVLHIAARLNATGRDAAGNFTFADFTMRAGTMSLGTAKQSELSVGDEFTVNDPLTGVTETLTLGPMITTPEGRVFHQLARPVDGATQAELYQHFAREYPEMIWFLDMFIDPALAGLRQTINGIEVPVFNRFAAAAMMADGNPNFSPLTAYTPDVLVTRSLIGAISGAWHKSGVRSPGRKYKSGTSREGGHVRDLLSGFNVRTWQMLQEKSRREWMKAVLKSAKPIRQNQVPEGWVKLETGMEELWQAVKRLRNWKSPVLSVDVTDEVDNGGIEEVEANLEKGQYLKQKGNRWLKFDKLYPETEARMTERGEVNDADIGLEYKHFFGEAARMRGKQLMLPQTLVDQLVRKYVAQVEHGTLYRLGSWLVRNSTQLFLVAPVTVVNNVLTNDMFTLQAATRRILSGVAGGQMQDLRFARELFTAEFFKWFPGLRTLVDPQWRAAMNADVLPENLFADQTMLADLKVRLDEDPLTYLRQGEIGAAALNFIRYGNIDTRAKTRMAYAWLRAQAVTNARKAGLRGAALRASVDAYLANPPIADMASAVEVAGFELLNYADSPAWLEDMASGKFSAFGGTADVGDFGRLVMPFPRFGYHFMAKTAREASAVKLLLGKVPKSQRAAAFADLITFLIWPAGGLGILAAYGLKGLGDDDDEARKRVGTASIKTVDADGNVVSKPLPRELITSNRINLSAWARGVGIGTDREEDSWLRIRSYPTIATAGAALLAMEDARKFGFAEGAKTYLGAVKDLASDFFSVGWMVKVPAKVLNDLGNNRLERTVVDPYAAGVPTLAYVVDQTLDSFVPGTRQFDIAVKWLDPVQRRRASSKTLGFEPTVWDAARVGHVTGLMDRLFAGADGTTASTLPPEGKIDRRTSSVPVPQEYSLQQRITELVGFNVRPIDRSRYEEALSPYATRN